MTALRNWPMISHTFSGYSAPASPWTKVMISPALAAGFVRIAVISPRHVTYSVFRKGMAELQKYFTA